jgi:hypothetical protein
VRTLRTGGGAGLGRAIPLERLRIARSYWVNVRQARYSSVAILEGFNICIHADGTAAFSLYLGIHTADYKITLRSYPLAYQLVFIRLTFRAG